MAATAFDQDRGFIDSITVSKGSASIYNVSYDYDNKGTTELRTSQYYDQNHVLSQTISEDFVYSTEGHSRLTDRVMTVTNAALGNHVSTITESMGYDGFGNITRKTGFVDNTYTYDQTNPYQLNTVAGNRNYSMVYDAHGNITHDGQREFRYSSSDMPLKIEQSGAITEFAYGPDNQRFYRKDSRTENGVATTTETSYAGKVYEQNHKKTGSQSTPSIEHRWYIGPVVITNFESGPGEQYEVLHGDALGSTVAVTRQIEDSQGNKETMITAHYLYDAWGKQSQIMTVTTSDLLPIALGASRRAYTGHENVEGLDIIHMNGRIYDPLLARFMQADPYVQAPTNSQSYNRYSYVFNNPLSYTDPSGYSAWTKFRDKVLKPVAAIAITVWTGGLAAGYGLSWAGFGIAAAGGAASGFIVTGSLKGALTGAFSGAAFFGIGQYFQAASNANAARARQIGNLAEAAGFDGALHSQIALDGYVRLGGNYLTAGQVAAQIASHAIAGGIIADLSGGKFGNGFLSAGVTKGLGSPILDQVGAGVIGGTVAASILGGTVSELTGGKFANGASTAAFQAIFNHYSQPIKHADSSENWVMEGEHFYSTLNPICTIGVNTCSVDEVAWVMLESGAFPGQVHSLTPYIGSSYVSNVRMFGDDHIRTYVGRYSITNATLNDHFLFPGFVTRSAFAIDQTVYIQTIGVGWGYWGGVNNAGKNIVWGKVDAKVRQHFE